MPSYKVGRLSEDLKRELSVLLREVKDPRVSRMLSILRCEVSGDLSHCKVHVSALEGEAATKESIKGLNSASGFLRKEIANRLTSGSARSSTSSPTTPLPTAPRSTGSSTTWAKAEKEANKSR